MELRNQETRAPLHIFVALMFCLLQLCAATAQTSDDVSSTQSSISISSSSKTSTRNFSSIINEPFSLRWKRRRNRRRQANKESIEFLLAHNVIRARLGEPPLIWDRGLAAYARSFAKKNVNACNLIHVNPDSSGPGENAFWGKLSHWTPTEVVKKWADEDKFYDMESNTCEPGQECGHYTQIVWKETTNVGCVRMICITGGVYALCLYTPPGNYAGESPFGILQESPSADTD